MPKLLLFIITTILIVGCNPFGKKRSDRTNDSKDNNFSIIRGTVPGTLITAICENNKTFTTKSIHNDTNQHPFELNITQGLECVLQMTTNENSDQNITTLLSFTENGASGKSFKGLANNINLGFINLPLDKSSIVDENNDSIVDTPIAITIIEKVDVLDVDDSGRQPIVTYDAYDPNKTYNYLDRVTYNGENFEAKEWNRGSAPDYTQTGKWKPLSYNPDITSYDEYNYTQQYHHPNRIRFFDVVYEAKFDTIYEAINPDTIPSDLSTSHWRRLGE